MNLGFVTCEGFTDFNPREPMVVQCFRDQGFNVIPYIWDNAVHARRDYDAIIINTPWDYPQRFEEFANWIDALPEKNVFNPKHILKWNLDKTYLKDLSAKGIPLVPTQWAQAKTESDLREIIHATGWADMVIKPAQSAGAYNTVRFSKDNLPDLKPYLNSVSMIQPLVKEILTEGEWSLLYFGGEFSHAVVKTPKSGDFRVQSKHGGLLTSPRPTPRLIDFGKRVLKAVGETLLYARVDFVMIQENPYLMELEILEPELFCRVDDGAPLRLVNAFREMSGLSQK